MENLFLLKIEIFVLILSLAYIIYYFFDKICKTYSKYIKIIKPRNNIKKDKNNELEIEKEKKLEDYLQQKKDDKTGKNKNKNKIFLSEEDKKKINDILKKIIINNQKGYLNTSKSLIIEGLTIDKTNKDLNLQLAFIYERDKNYSNSEFIYKDLLKIYRNDIEIRKKLGFNLVMQNKLKKSLEIYEEAFKRNRNDIEVVEMLSDISYDLGDFNKSLKYLNIFLKEKSRNIDKLFMKGFCLEKLNKLTDAYEIYNKILKYQPYNTKAKDKVKILEKYKK